MKKYYIVQYYSRIFGWCNNVKADFCNLSYAKGVFDALCMAYPGTAQRIIDGNTREVKKMFFGNGEDAAALVLKQAEQQKRFECFLEKKSE